MKVAIITIAEELMTEESAFRAFVAAEVSTLAAEGHRGILIRILNAAQRAAERPIAVDDSVAKSEER